jgi:sterol desaturase/sphingolipid hydroxylase (fatty acid hydroxylase superfamily)
MAHLPINHSDIPIRLFKSDFLEFFSHIHPAVVVAIWLPVALFALAYAILSRSPVSSAFYIPAGFLLGVFLWTLTEYTLHRFVFHFEARNPMQEKIIFLFHGIHHAQPQCKTRLVMPPVVSIPLGVIVYGLLTLLLGVILKIPQWIAPLISGMVIGYLIYDLTHYATHHFPMRQGYLKFIKRYHMQHHYKTPNQRFGVSSPLWDMVFGTLPSDPTQAHNAEKSGQ